MVGHYSRNLLLFNYSKNILFHSRDIKGVNRPFDILFNPNGNDIIYCFSNSDKVFLEKVDLNDNTSANRSLSYFTAVHGRLIHTVKIEKIFDNEDYLIITGSEDTNINFYYVNLHDLHSLKFIDGFTRHSGAVREINIIEKLIFEKENLLQFTIASVGAGSECFLFSFSIWYYNNTIYKHEIIFLCDLSRSIPNLDTRYMGITSKKINFINRNRLYLIANTNTLGYNETFIFDFDLTQHKPHKNLKLALKDTFFIALNINIVQIEQEFFIIYGLTNGVVYLQKILITKNISITELDLENYQYKVHQAGINDIKVFKNQIISCGEDSTVNILKLDTSGNLEIIKQLNYIHSAPIKSLSIEVCLNDLYLITGGYDQLINIIDSNRVENKKIKTCVAEINSINSFLIESSKLLIVAAGQGLELYKCNIR